MQIEFNDEKHLYTVDGAEVPSVTQLVAPLGADMDEPDDYMDMVLDAATDRGVTMHAYLEHRLKGGSAEEFELPAMYEPYAEAAELFLAEHTIEPLLVEQPLGCATFAGTPDLVCEMDGITSIVDYKFVSQIAKSKVGAQLAGYDHLCRDNGIYVDALYAVQFLRDGTYRLYDVDQMPSIMAFDLCRRIYEIKCKKHPRGRIG